MTEDYIDSILYIMSTIDNDAYYVKMAVAWTLSVCYVHFPKENITIDRIQNLDTFVHNKTIQKICESLRVSKEDKEKLRLLKK